MVNLSGLACTQIAKQWCSPIFGLTASNFNVHDSIFSFCCSASNVVTPLSQSRYGIHGSMAYPLFLLRTLQVRKCIPSLYTFMHLFFLPLSIVYLQSGLCSFAGYGFVVERA